ncbi:hypothetical protein AB0C15_17745 [Micromonospora sp. NPDC048835]|uniref:hypothetical protein n=1 Tax=Micromonospora sp. NPDC048835 TaxID=3155147 RepID=UPI0034071DE2
MTTRQASGLSTVQGHYWHAVLLGNRSLARRLQPRAFLDRRALGGVLLGTFRVVLRWLDPNPNDHAEIRQFAERVTSYTYATYGVPVDEVSQCMLREMGEAPDDDVEPAHPGIAELAVVMTGVRDLELKPGDIDRMISGGEEFARQWGITLAAYRPGPIMRWRFEMAEGRWYGYSARRRWSAERMGAFTNWLRDDDRAV